jgi:hypothetical protein
MKITAAALCLTAIATTQAEMSFHLFAATDAELSFQWAQQFQITGALQGFSGNPINLNTVLPVPMSLTYFRAFRKHT